MSIQRWDFKPGFQPCADGDWVEYKKHLAAMKRVKDALRVARKYVVSHSPAAIVSEVQEIDTILAEKD
jgi:hypothetical protein